MAGVRRTRTGAWELTVRSKLLPKVFYATFDTEDEARTYGVELEACLARGIVPEALRSVDRAVVRTDPLLVVVIREYSKAVNLPASDAALLDVIIGEVKQTRVSQVTIAWAETYVKDRQAEHLAPGTIRKRVGSLARMLDWHLRRSIPAGQAAHAVNPLRLLPRGYSSYSAEHREQLEAAGQAVPADISRDRRMAPDEEARILAALAGEKRPDRERALELTDGRALEVLFRMILATGMRLREAYTLRSGQVDLVTRTITVYGTNKRGGAPKLRHVPMTREVHALMSDWCSGRVGLLFPWWDGSRASLDRVTNRLSQTFRRLFDYAQVPNFTEHDLRHEATCRWVLMRDKNGAFMFSDLEICKVMGWSDPRMMLRYASLRGSDLAARLA